MSDGDVSVERAKRGTIYIVRREEGGRPRSRGQRKSGSPRRRGRQLSDVEGPFNVGLTEGAHKAQSKGPGRVMRKALKEERFMQELIMFRVSNKEAERAGGSERGEIVIPRVVRSNLEEPTDGRVQNLIGRKSTLAAAAAAAADTSYRPYISMQPAVAAVAAVAAAAAPQHSHLITPRLFLSITSTPLSRRHDMTDLTCS